MMQFSDGMEFDLQAPLHTERRSDGWYVVGGGHLAAVRSEAEGEALIGKLKKLKKENTA